MKATSFPVLGGKKENMHTVPIKGRRRAVSRKRQGALSPSGGTWVPSTAAPPGRGIISQSSLSGETGITDRPEGPDAPAWHTAAAIGYQ